MRFLSALFLGLSLISTVTFGRTITLTENNSVAIRTPFYDEFITPVMQDILKKHSLLPPEEPMYIILDTPGGSVDTGNQLINLVKGLGREVHTITKFAASMGFITMQSLDDRLVFPNASVMSHRAWTMVYGQYPGELVSRFHFDSTYLDETMTPVAKRLGMTVQELTTRHYNEAWFTTETALKNKVADEEVLVICDPTLSGTTDQVFDEFFLKVRITWSKCPAISAPLGITFEDHFRWDGSNNRDEEKKRAIHMMLYNKQGYYNNYIITGEDRKLLFQ